MSVSASGRHPRLPAPSVATDEASWRPGAWDVVRVPFPYAERPIRRHRPALVVAAPGTERIGPLLWVLMITSAANRGWPGDVPIEDLVAAGLPTPSLVRTAKIATIEAGSAEPLGSLAAPERENVRRALRTLLAEAELF